MSGIADDAYNKLRKNIGNDFSKGETGTIKELFSFHCGKCGYHNIHNVKELECGCGSKLQGVIVYRKIGDTVVYDMRRGKKRRKFPG